MNTGILTITTHKKRKLEKKKSKH